MTDYAMAHPWMMFLLVLAIVQGIFLLVNRLFRCLNIRKQGWPPVHCDADGDPLQGKS